MDSEKVTAVQIRGRKGTGRKIVAVTAYDATMARLLDEAGVDLLLVGDSLGMVVQGRPNTLTVTLEEICYHGRAVARGARRAHLVGDLPFMTYQVSPEQALLSAGRLVQEGDFEAVKLEGGERVAAHVERIVRAGIPALGHIGLTPQSVHAFGGFRVQGREPEAAQALLEDARALEQAGAYAIVLEALPAALGKRISEAVRIPTIGIGAGPHCDGQVLVCYDLLGLYRDITPKFVKRYAELGEAIVAATRAYAEDVQVGRFPTSEHCFGMARAGLATESTGARPVVAGEAPGYEPASEDEA